MKFILREDLGAIKAGTEVEPKAGSVGEEHCLANSDTWERVCEKPEHAYIIEFSDGEWTVWEFNLAVASDVSKRIFVDALETHSVFSSYGHAKKAIKRIRKAMKIISEELNKA